MYVATSHEVIKKGHYDKSAAQLKPERGERPNHVKVCGEKGMADRALWGAESLRTAKALGWKILPLYRNKEKLRVVEG